MVRPGTSPDILKERYIIYYYRESEKIPQRSSLYPILDIDLLVPAPNDTQSVYT